MIAAGHIYKTRPTLYNRAGMNSIPQPEHSAIRLVVLDVDGVLSKGETAPFDHAVLATLCDLNRSARLGHEAPHVTLCTGRPSAYVDAVMQAIDGSMPAVFEGGAGIYEPEGYRFYPVPGLGDLNSIRTAHEVFRRQEETTGDIMVQPGKDYTISLFPTVAVRLPELAEYARTLLANHLGEAAGALEFSYSASCLNIQPAGCDKGTGLRYISSRTGISLNSMLGVGDSEVDLPFLALTTHSAAPANSTADVRELVEYVSPHPEAAGLLDILRRYGILPE